MTAFFSSFFTFFLTWWGAFLLGALDSSMLFFLPFGIDTVVIYLAPGITTCSGPIRCWPRPGRWPAPR
jgi:hypothetical protein